MKVKPLSPVAVAAARRVLVDADVRAARDIHVEAIAARNGAMVLYGVSRTSRGHIVRAGKRAIVHVDERVRDAPPARFTIAHELGHHVMHDVADHFLQCEGGEAREGRVWRIEREANDFAAELLIPEALAAPHLRADRPTLDDVERLARVFVTSLEAAAIRIVQLTRAPCAAVLVAGGVIRWALETEAFPGRIVRGRKVHEGSVAARLAGGGEEESGAREVAGEVWGGRVEFFEEAVRVESEGVLVWVVPSRRRP